MLEVDLCLYGLVQSSCWIYPMNDRFDGFRFIGGSDVDFIQQNDIGTSYLSRNSDDQIKFTGCESAVLTEGSHLFRYRYDPVLFAKFDYSASPWVVLMRRITTVTHLTTKDGIHNANHAIQVNVLSETYGILFVLPEY